MAHAHLAHLAAQSPRTERLRKRQGRVMRAVRPSRAVELWYRAELQGVVDKLRVSGEDLASNLRPSWPRVGDQVASGLGDHLDRLGLRLGAYARDTAARLTSVGGSAQARRGSVVRRAASAVDERLTGAIRESLGGLDVSHLLADDGLFAHEMAAAADTNAGLIASLPEQYIARVRDAVEKGSSHGDVVDGIRRAGDMAETRARLIARDQVGTMTSNFNRARQTGLGIQSYVWTGATASGEGRSSHRAMEGKVVRWDSPPELDGQPLHAGQGICCRCYPRPVVNLDDLNLGVAKWGNA